MIGLDLTLRQTQAPAPAPLADFFRGGGGQSVALARGPDNSVAVWTEIAPNFAARLTLDNTNPTTRYSWRETLVMELRNVYPVSDLTLAGSWSQLQSSGSGVSGSYTGNRAVSTSSGAATAELVVDRQETYDVWVVYTGRTSGGYCRVDIDGSQTLVTEISDPANLGFKAFSTYSGTDLQRRQSVKVATGLTGPHVVTLSSGGPAVPGDNAIMIEAVAITGALGDPRILPPVWQPQTSYTMGDEVQFGGLFYAARASGLSGTTAPTHAAGIASDGALDWRADDRSTYPTYVAIDYASEREYAVRLSAGGPATEIGGQTHGNEALQSRDIMLDGSIWNPATAPEGLNIGSQISIVETTTWQLSGGGNIGECQLTRLVTPGVVRHDVDLVGTGSAQSIDWLYAGMVPMVRWDGEFRTTVVDTVEVAGAAPVALSGFAGINPPNLNYPDARRIAVSATVNGRSLFYGHEAGSLPISGNLVNHFDTFLRPNLNATTESGGLDWQAKAYVVGSADGGISLGAGSALGFFNRHVFRIA